MTIVTSEHSPIDANRLEGLDADALRQRINYDTRRFVTEQVNLVLCEFSTTEKKDVFTTYYRIGAEWLDEKQTKALVVTPKVPNIDFLEMFMTCLRTSEPDDDFSTIYDIDFDARPIKSKALNSILSPLLVVQFLNCVERIASRILRKGYVARHENLCKVKGRIDVIGNERRNLLTGHRESVLCKYNEYSVDTPENRYIKRGLLVARDMISLMAQHKAYATLAAKCGSCLSAFADVSPDFQGKAPQIKHNKLFRDYTEALRLALMLQRRQDISLSKSEGDMSDYVPVFRIDMALLFEHYALAMLRERYGSGIMYQDGGYGKRFVADFLLNTPSSKVILDTKYIPNYDTKTEIDPQYIMQLSGYARDKSLLKALGIDCSDEDAVPVVPCMILYPVLTERNGKCFRFTMSNKKRLPHTLKFYKCQVPVPLLPLTKSRIPK